MAKREQIHGVSYDIEPVKPLNFAITALDVSEEISESDVPSRSITMMNGLYELLQIFKFTARRFHERAFLIKNRGNLPLIVSAVSIENRGCAAFGFGIRNCIPFILKPNEVTTIFIQYQAKGALNGITKSVVFTTPYGDQKFPIKVSVTLDSILLIQRYLQRGK